MDCRNGEGRVTMQEQIRTRSWDYAVSWAAKTVLALVVACSPLTAAGAGIDPTAWRDLGLNYSAPAGSAYYPSVLYDSNGFGVGGPGFKMWYSDGVGNAYAVSSPDGVTWGAPTELQNLSSPHHLQVLYDAGGFGGSANKYRVWYWDTAAPPPIPYSVENIACAESTDGINWAANQAITQDGTYQVVTGADPDWNRGSYGPVCVFYKAAGSPTPDGSDVFGNRFVMYYDGTTGGQERAGLAYSADGKHWFATTNPATIVLDVGPVSWDANFSSYGTVLRDGATWHYWFSGGAVASSEGIGYASSNDGIAWAKDAGNPIFHISDGVAYRNLRTDAPCVIRDGSGLLRMYFTARANGDPQKRIALAINAPPSYDTTYVDDDWTTQPFLSQVFFPGDTLTPHHVGLDAFAGVQDGVNAVASGGTVNVAPGTYSCALQIQKPLTLQSSDGPSATTIQGDPNSPYVVQIWASGVTIKGFTVTNPNYAGGSDPSGIVIDGGTNSGIHLTNNVIHDVCTSTRSPASFGTTGIVMGPVSDVEVDHNIIYNIWHGSSDPANGGAAGIVLWGNSASDGPSNVAIHDNTIYGITSPRDDAGIRLDPFARDVTIQNNAIADSGEYGIWIEPDQVNAPVITHNSIAGGTILGLDNRSDVPIDATDNWWGHLRGPRHATNANTGAGVVVSNGVNFSPWLGDGTDTQSSVPGFQPNLSPRYAIPTRLAFSAEPGGATAEDALAPQPVVQAQDATGYLGINYAGRVVLVMASNPAQGVLSGTLSQQCSDGIGSYTGLSVDRAGTGYSLEAMAYELSWAASATFTVTNPIPALISISPGSADADSSALVLIVTGSGFVDGSKVQWNGAPRPTLFSSSTELAAFIAASDLVSPGKVDVTVCSVAPGGGTSAATAFVIADRNPVLDSGAFATPNPAGVGQTVTFSVAGHGADGQAVTVVWDFGDGTSGSGASTTHVYTAAATFRATAAVLDIQGRRTISAVTVTVLASALPPTLEPLTITKKNLRARNPSTGKDTCRLTGWIVLPQGLSSLSGPMQTDVGGLSTAFALDSKGRGKSGASTFKLAAKMKKGVLQTQTVRFHLKAAGDFQQVLNTAGRASGTSGNVTLQVQFVFSGKVYAAAMPLTVKGTPRSAVGK